MKNFIHLIAVFLFASLLWSNEDLLPIVLTHEEYEISVKMERTFIKDGLTIEGLGTFDYACGLLTFYKTKDGGVEKIGDLLKKGWHFESTRDNKPLEWKLFAVDEKRFIVVGYAVGEQELVCEFVNLGEELITGKTAKLGTTQFFLINVRRSGFIAATAVSLEAIDDKLFLNVETTTGDVGRFEVDFGNGTLTLID